MARSESVIMEPKPKKLWLKDGEAVKTFVSITAVTTSAVGLLIILAAVLFG